jgi:hypothetical protein
MTDSVYIYPELEALTTKLGYEAKNVREITIGLHEATVLAFRLDEDGSKFVQPNGQVATEWRKIKIAQVEA